MAQSEDAEDAEGIEGKPWTRKGVLEDHLDDGETYQEIADQYGGASFDSVGYWVRKYDLTATKMAPKYDSRTVPTKIVSELDVEHPLPEFLMEEFGVENGDYARFSPQFEEGEIVVDLNFSDELSGRYSNESRLTSTNTRHLPVRYPRMLANAINLFESAGTENSEATLFSADESTLRVSFSPTPDTWEPAGGDPPAGLTEKIKPLLPLLGVAGKAEDERTIDDVEKYRLDFPLSYIDAYDMRVEDDVVMHIAPAPDADRLAIYVDFEADADGVPKSMVRRLQSYTNGTENAVREQVCFYPGMVLLHSLDIGDSKVRPSARLVPGNGWLAIVPMN